MKQVPPFVVIVLLLGVLCLVPSGAAIQAAPSADWSGSDTPMLLLTTDGIVREWPSPQANVLGSIPDRATIPTNGRTVDSQWWRVPYPGGPDGNGWVTANIVQANAAAASVPNIQVIFATPTPAPVPPTPTPPSCMYNSAYVTDVSIPDHTQIQAAQSFNKVWRLSNTGSCTWEQGTTLAYTRGFKLSAPDAVAVPVTAPGGTADIGVQMFAPANPGSYTGVWQLRNAAGQFFGSGVTVVIDVPDPNPAPQPQPTPIPPQPSPGQINFWADTYRLNAGQCTNIHWDVRNVRAIYLEYAGHTQGVTGQETKWVCPSNDGKRYILHVDMPDGSRQDREIKIDVNPGPKPGPTATPKPKRDRHVNVSVNPGKILMGECTTVSWDVGDMHKIHFDGQSFYDHRGSYQWCPNKTTTKTFTVCYESSCGDRKDKDVKVKVEGLMK